MHLLFHFDMIPFSHNWVDQIPIMLSNIHNVAVASFHGGPASSQETQDAVILKICKDGHRQDEENNDNQGGRQCTSY